MVLSSGCGPITWLSPCVVADPARASLIILLLLQISFCCADFFHMDFFGTFWFCACSSMSCTIHVSCWPLLFFSHWYNLYACFILVSMVSNFSCLCSVWCTNPPFLPPTVDIVLQYGHPFSAYLSLFSTIFLQWPLWSMGTKVLVQRWVFCTSILHTVWLLSLACQWPCIHIAVSASVGCSGLAW